MVIVFQVNSNNLHTCNFNRRIISAEILSRPVALDLHNLFRCEKTTLLLVKELVELVVIYIYIIDIT